MLELAFKVVGAEPDMHAMTPTLRLRLAISQSGAHAPVDGITLHCQLRIEARQRYYRPQEKERLRDLFGDPDHWSRSLQSLLWTHVQAQVPRFDGVCEIDLPVPCSFDFNLAATKYFHGVQRDKLPLLLLFSGTIFHRDGDGALTMQPIAQDREAKFRLPCETWQALMDAYYPNRAWLCLNREVFEALYAYKQRNGFTGFDDAVSSLLPVREALAS